MRFFTKNMSPLPQRIALIWLGETDLKSNSVLSRNIIVSLDTVLNWLCDSLTKSEKTEMCIPTKTLCPFSAQFPVPIRGNMVDSTILLTVVARKRRPLSPVAWAAMLVRVSHYLRNMAALEIHNSVPSLHLSSLLGPAPLGSFIFVLMAAVDNGAAEKSQKVKTQLWQYQLSVSSSRWVHQYISKGYIHSDLRF